MAKRNLLVIPSILKDESLSSYIARICQMHSVYPNALLQGLSMRKFSDCDLEISPKDLKELVNGTKLIDHDIALLTSPFYKIRSKFLARTFLNFDNHVGYYKYCPECLESDPVPYWRWEWRFKHYEICLVHRSRLFDRCYNCSLRVQIKKNDDKRYRSYQDAGVMNFCLKCGACLSEIDSKVINSIYLDSYLKLQFLLTDACLNGTGRMMENYRAGHSRCLAETLYRSLIFSPYTTEIWGKDEVDSLKWRVLKINMLEPRYLRVLSGQGYDKEDYEKIIQEAYDVALDNYRRLWITE